MRYFQRAYRDLTAVDGVVKIRHRSKERDLDKSSISTAKQASKQADRQPDRQPGNSSRLVKESDYKTVRVGRYLCGNK